MAGLYYVTVTATGTSTTADTTLALQLYSNGVAQPGAISQATVATANGVVELVINKIVRVLPNCQALNSNVPNVLTIVNTSTAKETVSNCMWKETHEQMQEWYEDIKRKIEKY